MFLFFAAGLLLGNQTSLEFASCFVSEDHESVSSKKKIDSPKAHHGANVGSRFSGLLGFSSYVVAPELFGVRAPSPSSVFGICMWYNTMPKLTYHVVR